MKKDIIEVLNQNPQAKKLLGTFEKAAEAQNFTPEEYQETRKTVFMLAMAMTPEAMEIMAGEVWEEINGQGAAK